MLDILQLQPAQSNQTPCQTEGFCFYSFNNSSSNNVLIRQISCWPAFQKKNIDTSDAGFFTEAAMMQLRRDDLQNVVAVQCMDRSRKMIGSPLVDFK